MKSIDPTLGIVGLLASTLKGKRAPKPVARKRHLTKVLIRDRRGMPYVVSSDGVRRNAIVNPDHTVEYAVKTTKQERKAARKARKKATRSTLT